MAGMTTDELRTALSDGSGLRGREFSVLRAVSVLLAAEATQEIGHEMVLRCLEHREAFSRFEPVLDGLVRSIGLFPHLSPETLGSADRLAHEFHKPAALHNKDLVLHRAQAMVYQLLDAGKNLILSAPTSFGKSLLLDTMVASRRFQNIAVIVPTIALMDETRRRLSVYSPYYKIITHSSQALADRNVFVVTQERLLEFEKLPSIQFFAIDEFYKLDPEDQRDNRSLLLNQVFYRLLQQKSQFFLLGPGIEGIMEEVEGSLRCEFIKESYRTVAADVFMVESNPGNEIDALIALLKGLAGDQTLIYCRSPMRVREVCKALVEAGIGTADSRMRSAAQWIGQRYHPEWQVVKGLAAGVGSHHAQLPRSVGRFMVRMFNEGKLPVLCCTSTLIEGVNTSAKNVVIFDNRIARKKFDYFTFNNIAGRSGRLMQHFVGRVYLFHEPPKESLPSVEFPFLAQGEDVPASLLLQLEPSDLSQRSRDRLKPYRDSQVLPVDVLKGNRGVDLNHQIELAEEIASDPQRYARSLGWTDSPTGSELKAACELIWTFFVRSKQRQYGVSSGPQLAFRLNALRFSRSTRQLIDDELKGGRHETVDDAVETVLGFMRHWASFAFPRYLMALDSIQRTVLERAGYEAGTFSSFAGRTENLFKDGVISALDEYGVPVEIGEQLLPGLRAKGSLDVALERLRELDTSQLNLTSFERDVLEDAIRGL